MEIIILVLVVLSSTILGLFVFNSNPKSATNKIFLALSVLIAIWSIVIYLSLATSSRMMTLILVRLTTSIAVPLTGSFLLLMHTFPSDKLKMSRKEFFGLITLFVSTMLLTFSPFVFTNVKVVGSSFAPVAGPGMVAFAVAVNGAAIISVILLIRRFIKSKGIEKLQLNYLLIGFLVMISLIIITIFFPVALFQNISFVSYGPLYALIFLLTTSYAIVRHRFLDVRFIVARAVAYILLLLFIGLCYIAVLFNIAFFINERKSPFSTLSDLIIPTIVALLFALTFQPLRRFFEKITDKLFYKDHYESNDLLWDLSRSMASTLGLDQLCKGLLNILLSTIKINYGAVILVRKDVVIWASSTGSTSLKPLKSHEIANLIGLSYKPDKRNENILIFDEMGGESAMKQSMRDHGLTIVIPLIVRKELIGGLVLGEKSSGEIYSSEDVELLKIVAPEVAVAVRNALSYEEIKKFNITLEQEVKKATQRLRKANIRLKELDQLKDEFVSIASHELRTPMTAIKSYLWMAINKSPQKLQEPLKKYLDISYKSTERLIHLVNDMLTVSRIERNKIEIKKEPVNVIDVLSMVYEELKITATEKKINFVFEFEKGEKYIINADKDKIREVFQNLVGNALKFTPEGGKIELYGREKGKNIEISVSDTGPGILKEDQSKLFQKFSKIDYSYSSHPNQPGTGLGLYISKQIVSLHLGDIHVESDAGKGSIFTVTLPLLVADALKNE